jgi:hypothetical protein
MRRLAARSKESGVNELAVRRPDAVKRGAGG